MYPIFNGFSFRKEKKNYPIFINYQLIIIRSLCTDFVEWEVIGPSLIKGFIVRDGRLPLIKQKKKDPSPANPS